VHLNAIAKVVSGGPFRMALPNPAITALVTAMLEVCGRHKQAQDFAVASLMFGLDMLTFKALTYKAKRSGSKRPQTRKAKAKRRKSH
jgi:hypothetical protein